MVATTIRRLTHPHVMLWLFIGIIGGGMLQDPLKGLFTAPMEPNKIFHHNELRIGLDPSRPPFAFFTDDGNYTGLEVELGESIGEMFDLPVRFVGLGFDGLYDALKTDQVDIVIAGLQPVYHIDGNAAVYSRHYFNAGLVLIGTSDIEKMEDLPGKSLAYEFGSTADAITHRWLRRIRPFELRPYELPEYAMDAIRIGDADAALVDATTAHLYLKEYPDMTVGFEQVTDAWYTVTIRSDRSDMLNIINSALQWLSQQGRLDDILNRWL